MKYFLSLFVTVITLSVFTSTNAISLERMFTYKGKKYPMYGTSWYRAKTREVYRTFPCGGGVGMRVVKSPNKKYRNKVISCGSRRIKGTLEFAGRMLNTRDGRTYKGKTIIKASDPNTMILRGCVLGGLICANEYLRRVR